MLRFEVSRGTLLIYMFFVAPIVKTISSSFQNYTSVIDVILHSTNLSFLLLQCEGTYVERNNKQTLNSDNASYPKLFILF